MTARLSLRPTVETLLIATAGGSALGLTGFPAGWLSGAILTVAVVALAGRTMHVPLWLVRVTFVVVGTSLGSVVTPEMLHGMASYPFSITTLIVAIGCASVAGTVYLRVVHRWTLISAYLGAMPGALSTTLAVAADVGADLRAIAIVQTIRVVIVAVGLPGALAFAGFVDHAARVGQAPASWALADELALLIAVSTVCGVLAHRARLPGGLLFGAMISSGVLHGIGSVHVGMPHGVTLVAMMILGAIIGARFTNTPLRLLLNYGAAGVGTFAVTATVALSFAAVLIQIFSLPVPETTIAFTPGSVDAMMILALALHVDPLFVGAHHIARILSVTMTMPFVARYIARRPLPADRERSGARATFQD